MFDFIKKIRQSNLFKVGLLNNVSLCLRMLTGVVTAKLLAVFVGPSGMALMGNFRNFLASLEAVATLGFTQGIVKYVATYKNDPVKLSQWISTVLLFVLGLVLIAAMVLLSFRAQFNTYIFGDAFSFEFLFVVLAFVFPLQVLNGVFIAIINGLERYKTVIYIQIIGNVLGFALTVFLMYYWTLNGALLALILAPAATGICSYLWIHKDIKFDPKAWNIQFLKPLFSYSAMALFSAVVAPLTFFYIRLHIISSQGMDEAGYWEALLRISTFYMTFVVTLISVYFLPKLAQTNSTAEIRPFIKQYCLWVLPVFGIGMVLFYFCRTWLIKLLLDDQFLPVSDLMFWQLIGDFLKAFSLIYGILFYAKRLVVPYLITEVLSFGILYLSSIFFIDRFGTEGATMAHSFTYLIYSLVLVAYFEGYYRRKNS